ncbi:hypothetical protein PAXINDRAFT_20153 [Paxillus involutus ATCC 200175]|uniref:Uncharacterized protein n=1 Tax=Paxillus involutus ATCC 200175 TaxID=664439 RepID=A0A0C9TEU3_PAXIN|nr:hypothetical protein PAXINDRAFT_20153 [Paxillus involutus ATCC 200175]
MAPKSSKCKGKDSAASAGEPAHKNKRTRLSDNSVSTLSKIEYEANEDEEMSLESMEKIGVEV